MSPSATPAEDWMSTVSSSSWHISDFAAMQQSAYWMDAMIAPGAQPPGWQEPLGRHACFAMTKGRS